MILYRGQEFEKKIGAWWTSKLEEAQQFALQHGGSHLVLSVELPDEYAEAFEQFDNRGINGGGAWYRISPDYLIEHTLAVKVHQGQIGLRRVVVYA